MRDTKGTLIYILKRLLLMIFTIIVIFIICFMLVRLLPDSDNPGPGKDPTTFYRIQVAIGRYYEVSPGQYEQLPLLTQLWNFIKNLFVPSTYMNSSGQLVEVSRWGYSWEIDYLQSPIDILFSRMTPTVLINVYSMFLSIPIGLLIGIYMALKKNKWQDHTISTAVMIVISVPSYVYAFIIQYLLCFELGWFPLTMNSGYDYASPSMFLSMLPAVFSLSFGSIAGYARFTRAELTEVLTSEFMLLARTKGLTRSQATVRHALRNAMVPIFPMIIGEFISVLSGSLVIEKIFSIPGVGKLYLDSINTQDYDFFMMLSGFYTFVGLAAGIVIDISYGIIDPRIRMGAK